MKILFITNMYPNHGNQDGIFVKEQIEYLSQKYKIDPSLYFINGIHKGKIEYLKSIVKIWSLIRKTNVDIIHVHYGLSGIFLLFLRPKAKVFLTLHGGDILPEQGKYVQNYLSRLVMKRVQKVFLQNREMASVAKQLDVEYEILPCGINTDFFTSSLKGDDVKKGEKLILFPGNPARSVKNYQLFQETYAVIKKLSNQIIRFQCIHKMNRAEVRDVLSHADCLLMTSISEGSPQVIKEALACNLPVVSVKVGDVPEILKEIPTCAISRSYDAEELANLVIHAINQPRGNIRSSFLRKGVYDNSTICRRLYANYQA